MVPGVLTTVRRMLVPALAGVLLGGAVAGAVPGPAQAAVPDRWGFAYLQNPTPPGGAILDPARQWGGWKAVAPGLWATVTPIAVGRYRVAFPLTASRGVAHVTAISDAPRWCQVFRSYPSGTDQIVEVQCYRHGGAPDWSRFSVMYSSSSGAPVPAAGAYAYVTANPAGGLIHSYNSAGAANLVGHFGPGQYRVFLPGIGTGLFDGDIQVTAEHPNSPRRCKVARWGPSGGGYLAYVFCFDAANALADSWFNLSYHQKRAVFGALAPPDNLAYLWSPALGAGPSDYNSMGGVNSVVNAGVGQYLVIFPLVGIRETHVQVTAYGTTPDYCGLQEVWGGSGTTVFVRNVICFDAFGVRTPHEYLVTYSSRV